MHASTCYSQCTCTCPLTSPYACMPACSSRVLEHSCLIANCITTTFDHVIKTRVLVYIVQCINLWFTNMKQEENMVALLIRGMLMLSLVDSPVCLGSPSWCRLFCLLMPSLVLVNALSQVLMFPWTMMATGDSLVNILPNKVSTSFYTQSLELAARVHSHEALASVLSATLQACTTRANPRYTRGAFTFQEICTVN